MKIPGTEENESFIILEYTDESQWQKKQAGMEVFFIRYRKLLAVMCIILLVGFPFKLYEFPGFNNDNRFKTIGYCVDIIIYLAVLIWMVANVRKAYKTFNSE